MTKRNIYIEWANFNTIDYWKKTLFYYKSINI